MIRLLESDSPAMKLYDKIDYAGYNWIVIDIKNGVATLLWNDKAILKIFDRRSGVYKTSEIRKYLLNTLLPKLESNGAKPISTYLPDVGCNDKLYLLSIDEAEQLPNNIRKYKDYWWLRSRGGYDNHAAIVSTDGSVVDRGLYVNLDYYAVRPAMCVRLSDLQ